MSDITGSRAKRRAEESQKKQEESLARQRQLEGQNLAEAKNEVAIRQRLISAKRKGRSLLVSGGSQAQKNTTLGA